MCYVWKYNKSHMRPRTVAISKQIDIQMHMMRMYKTPTNPGFKCL